MFMPIHDGLALRRIGAPVVTYAIIVTCVVLHAASFIGLLPAVEPLLAAGFGAIPVVVFGQGVLPGEIAQAPWWLSPVTSLFLHGSWMHLIGNMLFLWVFADNVEDSMGHVRFLLFFLVCGVLAAFAHALTDMSSIRPLIGASGAISGVVAAYVLLFPRVRIWVLVMKYIPLPVPAWAAIGAWVGFQLFQALFATGGAVAWFAHIGGLAAGFLLAPLFLARGVALRAHW
jgi:membrane associated rhomboid family serine protease